MKTSKLTSVLAAGIVFLGSQAVERRESPVVAKRWPAPTEDGQRVEAAAHQTCAHDQHG